MSSYKQTSLYGPLAALTLLLPTTAGAVECSNLPVWDAAQAYHGGNQVQHLQIAYQANWWTQNQQPASHSGQYQEWRRLGDCDTGNLLPNVTLTSPLNGSIFSKNDNVVISAAASDPDGQVASVAFSVNGNLLLVDTQIPYEVTWPAAVGQQRILATVTDDLGATNQAWADIEVLDPDNQAPSVSLTNPTADAELTAGNNVTLSAEASDNDGQIQSVSFYVDNIQVGETSALPYQTNWLAVAGQHSFKARVIDDDQAESFSNVVTLMIADKPGGGCAGLPVYQPGTAYQAGQLVQNQNHQYRCNVAGWCSSAADWAYAPGTGAHWTQAWSDLGICAIAPTVHLDSPVDNAVLLAGAEVNIQASASDDDGSVTNVAFYANNQLLGQDDTPPYHLLWVANPSGDVQLKAIATDNDNNQAEDSVLVRVSNEPVVVSLTSPANGTRVNLGTSLTLTADASSAVAQVNNVAFKVNGVVISTDTSAPYSANWLAGSTGNYNLTAMVTDDLGNTATSSAVSVVVNATPRGKTHKLIGYWHNFQNPAGCPVPLGSISPRWDVIDIAFADNDFNVSGRVNFNLFDGQGSSCAGIDATQFKQDVAALQAQGKKVVLSLGGAEGTITLNTDADEQALVSSLTAIINEWGFDGLDIDLESGSNLVHGSQIQARLPRALKQIEKNMGRDMYLTMAPEHPYVQGGYVAYSGIWGAYIPLIDELRDTLDILHVQLYNNGGLRHPYAAQTAPAGSVDMMVASARMLLEGFELADGSRFLPLRDDQVALGLPSGRSSAGSGQASTADIIRALDCISKGTQCATLVPNQLFSQFAGVMTWSINWDIHDDYIFSVPIGQKLDAMNAGQ
ncbi:Ig-like domain-containing protein [Bowmanella denitrificans]|uniref:chitinase n=1 Tax=Bowmanella denitrificans TaxID=366582 RepID=A0ABN0X097_9ALTE